MADAEKQKDIWDKLSSVTPLVLGLAVSGVGLLFTQIYNYRQLQLNQITALEKLRPLLTSDKPEEREFGYASFASLGYEDVAIRIIKINKDQSGRPVLVELSKVDGSQQLQSSAAEALKSLDEAKNLINKLEFGDSRGLDPWLVKGNEYADELGMKTKLGRALIVSEIISSGTRAKRYAEAVSKALGGTPGSGVEEKAWISRYLDDMETRPGIPGFTRRRVQEFRGLVEKGDWNLATYKDAPVAPVSAGQQDGH